MTWEDEPTAPGEALRCAIYTWSSRAARRASVTTAQREACRRYLAEQHGLTVLAQSYDDIDDVAAAPRAGRPALQRLLDDITRRQIDIVAVERVDRLSGSPVELATLLEQFDAAGVALLSIDQGASGTVLTGQFTVAILRALGSFVVAS